MFRQLALVTFADQASSADRERILDAMRGFSGAKRNEVRRAVHGANQGDYVWHLHFDDEDAWRRTDADGFAERIAADAAVAVVDAVAYAPDPVQVLRPDLSGGIYRALLVSVEPGTDDASEARWLDEIRAMPRYIPEILNAATGKAAWSRGRQAWSHVWEQDYASLADLNGPYLNRAYHWGHVDRWFDAEMPGRIVKLDLCHSASEAPDSVIADYV